METATQITFILYILLAAAVGVAAIGKRSETATYTSASAAGAAFVYGLFTIAFMLWWDTNDTASLIAKITVLALLWVPWLVALGSIGKSLHQAYPLWRGLLHVGSCAVCVAAVLIYWV